MINKSFVIFQISFVEFNDEVHDTPISPRQLYVSRLQKIKKDKREKKVLSLSYIVMAFVDLCYTVLQLA